jgi:hypothetical protein
MVVRKRLPTAVSFGVLPGEIIDRLRQEGPAAFDRRQNMRKSIFLPVALLLGLSLAAPSLVSAAEKKLTLPKGTRVEKLGPGELRFVLPNGRTAEIKGYDARSGILGDCGVYAKGKLVMKGTRGSFVKVIDPDPPLIVKAPGQNGFVVFRGAVINLKTLSVVPKSDYVEIDDEVTWLPARIEFAAGPGGKNRLSPQPDPPGKGLVTILKGSTVQKLGPGHFKFFLPNRQVVEVTGYDARTGLIGDFGVSSGGKLKIKGGRGSLRGIINPDPPTVVRSGKKVFVVFGGEVIDLGARARIPHTSYVMIDDEVTWLPVTIRFN